MTTTVNLVCRVSGHDHDARLLSRWDDGRNGGWKPKPGFKPTYGEDFALIWGPSENDPKGEVHGRYKFPCGAEITQARLHARLDEARALGNTEITLD
ncbi:hypothetical protein LTA6_002619 [Microbacterium sp. LTA6]|uniref:hypothetical protein n=1 Tax=Microbacterium sp. LTA6 TaxID=3129771 RepID=UPI0032510DAA